MSGVGTVTVIYDDDSDIILISGSSTSPGEGYVAADGSIPLTATWNAEQNIQVTALGVGADPVYPLYIAKIFGDEDASSAWFLETLTGTLTTDRAYIGIGIAPTIEWVEDGNNLTADGVYVNLAPFGDSYLVRGGIFGAVNHQAVTMDTGIGVSASVYNLDGGGTLDVGKAIYAYIENAGTAGTTYLLHGEYAGGGSWTDKWGVYLSGADKNQLAGDLLIEGSNRYINFDVTTGVSGHGIRDNAGNIEYKDSGGSWTAFNSISGGGSFSTDELKKYFLL